MDIQSYGIEHSEEVAMAYSDAVRAVPHCHRVEAAEFNAAIQAGPDSPKTEPLRDKAAFVARSGGRVTGFADVGVGRSREEDIGVIRFLWYERGRRRVGQTLLDAAESHLRGQGVARIEAFPQQYRLGCYHFRAAFLSERLDCELALLGFNGYARIGGEVFLDWPACTVQQPAEPHPPLDVSVEWPSGKGERPGLVVRAVRDGRQLGVCENVCGGEYSSAEEAQDWMFTVWLGVEEDAQGAGLGKYLLQRALWEMRSAGYRHAAISTSLGNHRAFLFYSNLGYRTADWTYGLGRSLD
ncbi:MAG: GNAT family N-acetyltransferase [Candidatus Hydrogenedentes bacterium]|nr:GNAT family N-acetyltransferase [Candidatus Hydrogenedentota bacterium]